METRNARWETKEKYYTAIVQKDLFGQWVVFCQWGAKNSRHGGKKTIPVESFEMGVEQLEKIGKKRLSRGYEKSTNDMSSRG